MSNFVPNRGQRKAIHAPFDRPVRVVAGAGTGKTEVISRRFIYLLEQQRELHPRQLLVLTFTEKAAAEMRARIFGAVTRAELGYSRLDLAAAAISTFHSFGLRLLGDYSLRARVDAELPLLTDVDVQEMLDEAQQAFLGGEYKAAYGALDPLENGTLDWKGSGPFELARAVFTQLRDQAQSPEAFQQSVAAEKTDSETRRALAPLVHWLYTDYLARLAERGQLDFDRIIGEAARLLEQDAVARERVRAQYRYLLVDEYQDTNLAQEHMLRALAAAGLSNVTVVGDPRQAIYVWREARVENIAHFPGGDGPRIEAPLTENRRSLAPILSVANRAIQGYEFGVKAEFSAEDELVAYAGHQHFDGTVVSLHPAPTREEEAQAVIAWIRQAAAEGYAYKDIAILVRARTYLNAYIDALKAAGIPYELSSEEDFYLRPEILDAIHLLRVCLNPAEELSLARVLLSAAAGLTQAEVATLRRAGRGLLWQQVNEPAAPELSDELRERLSRFTRFWREAQQSQWLLPPAAFVAWAIHRAGLDASADAPGRRALQKLLAVAHGYEADHPSESLREMAEYLRRVLDGDPREKAPELRSGENAVRVLTAHASKGLEFEVVIAADSRQKIKPNRSKKPFHEPDGGLVIPEEDENDPRFVERVRRQRNEARCLWYVTLTRAKRRLIITATNGAERADGEYSKVQTFFEELWNREHGSPSAGVELCDEPPAAPAAPAAAGATSAAAADAAPALQIRSQLQARLSAPYTVHISATGFRRYQECPAAYRFYHLDRMEELEVAAGSQDWPPGDGAGMLLGSAFHQLAAGHARQPACPLEELLRDIRPTLAAAQRRTIKSWFTRYLQTELGHSLPEPAGVEQSLSLALEFPHARLALAGIADRLEATRLVDYKTDAQLDGLAERHGDQLRVYALAARRAGRLNRDADLLLYHAPSATTINVPFTIQDEQRLLGELEAMTETLVRLDPALPPLAGTHCDWCAARVSYCAVGRQWANEHGVSRDMLR